MLPGPLPGANRNSVGKPESYDRGGRQTQPVLCHQWLMTVSLDGLQDTLGLPQPTHIKIDVDGFENHVMIGARRLLAERQVRSWAIELNGVENRESVTALMRDAGYTVVAEWEHYPGFEHYSGDAIFVRDDLVDEYRERMARTLPDLQAG
ncbi:MAG: hypothetical protein VW644_00235 [Alphaproteobacteria bacterium]